VDWLEYVATLHKSGKFKDDLFEGWLPLLKLHHSDYKEPNPGNPAPRSALDLSNIARNSSNQGNSNWQQNQGQYQGQGNYNNRPPNNYNRPRGRGRGNFRGNNRGRYQKRGYSGSANYFNTY